MRKFLFFCFVFAFSCFAEAGPGHAPLPDRSVGQPADFFSLVEHVACLTQSAVEWDEADEKLPLSDLATIISLPLIPVWTSELRPAINVTSSMSPGNLTSPGRAPPVLSL